MKYRIEQTTKFVLDTHTVALTDGNGTYQFKMYVTKPDKNGINRSHWVNTPPSPEMESKLMDLIYRMNCTDDRIEGYQSINDQGYPVVSHTVDVWENLVVRTVKMEGNYHTTIRRTVGENIEVLDMNRRANFDKEWYQRFKTYATKIA